MMKEQTQPCIVCNNVQEFYFSYLDHDYYRCPLCGLVSTTPLPSEAQLESHYRLKFEKGNYSLLLNYREEYGAVYRQFVEVLQARLRSTGATLEGKKVLDIGCFTGDFLTQLNKEGADVYGIELQSEAVALANKTLPNRIFQADVYSDLFPRMQFDIITFTGLIEHVVDPVKLVRRVEELLVPGGLMLLQTPDSGSAQARLLRKYWPPYMPVEHIHLFSRRSVAIVLERHGFCEMKFHRHIKKLPISYIYRMFENFGPEFYRLLGVFYRSLPERAKGLPVSVYGGEMIVTAWKPMDG